MRADDIVKLPVAGLLGKVGAIVIEEFKLLFACGVITGILLIYGAVMMFIRAYRLRSSRGPIFTLVILFGILDLLLGITILINPVIFAEVITQLEGISLIVGGVGMIVTVWDVKRMARPR